MAAAASVYVGIGLALIFVAPQQWLKIVGGGMVASAPVVAALLQRQDLSRNPERPVAAVAASALISIIATAVAVAMVVEHPAGLFGGTSTRVIPKPRLWNGVPQPLGITGDWNLKLDSTFDGPALDTSVWQPGWLGTGVTGPANVREAACYSSDNVTFPGDGTMHLAITPEPSRCDGKTHPYTGAIVSSNPHDGRPRGGFTYTFGVLEARVYLPGAGRLIANWPAAWTIGQHWPNDGEDDVAEGLFGTVCFHFHSPGYAAHGPGACVPRIKPGWHTFASDWRAGLVTYYYDGLRVGTITTGITSKPMYIVIDNTVWRNQPATTRPATMRVAYVRVWQQANDAEAGRTSHHA